MLRKERIKIGWSETDITPLRKSELYGQYYQRVARGINSRLSATVLVVESASGEQIVMISLDMADFPIEFLNALRARVMALVPDIVPEKIMMNAIHTHCAPAVREVMNWWPPDVSALRTDDYRDFVLQRLSEGVRRAWTARKPGALAATASWAVLGHCRRAVYRNGSAEMYGDTAREDFTGMEGNEDSTVELLFTYGAGNKPSGVVVNIACPAQVMEATYKISSDFMGELRRLLKLRYGAKFYVLGQISAAGDQSPRDLIRNRTPDFWNEKGMAILGKRLADAVIGAEREVKKDDITGTLAMVHRVRMINLPKRFPTRNEYLAAQKELKALEARMPSAKAFRDFCAGVQRNEKIAGRPGPYDSKLHHFVLIRNAEAVVQRWQERAQGRDFKMELHVLRLGQIAFCSNPFELFLDFGQRLKARSRASQTFVVQLCCGTSGYLPTAAAERHGGYGGLIINGLAGSAGGDKLVAETMRDLELLF